MRALAAGVVSGCCTGGAVARCLSATATAVGLVLLTACGQAPGAPAQEPAAAVEDSGEAQGRLAVRGVQPGDTTAGVLVLDLGTGGVVRAGGQGEARSAAWAGSDRIAVVRGGAYAVEARGELVLAAADGSDEGTPIGGTADVLEVTASPDGAHLAWLGRAEHSDGACLGPAPAPLGLYVAAGDGTGVRRVTEVPAASSSPVLSPDGGTVAVLDHGDDTTIRPGRDWCDPGGARLVLVDVTTGAARVVTGTPEIIGAPRFSPDGATVVFGGGYFGTSPDADLVFVDVASGTARRVLTPQTSERMPVYSPDGQQLAVLTDAGGGDTSTAAVSVGRADGTGMEALAVTGTADEHLAWTPDGSHLVVAGAVIVPDCGEGATAQASFPGGGCDTVQAFPEIRTIDARSGVSHRVSDSGALPGGLTFAP